MSNNAQLLKNFYFVYQSITVYETYKKQTNIQIHQHTNKSDRIRKLK